MRAIRPFRWQGFSLCAAGLALLVSFFFDASIQTWIAQHQSAEMRNLMREVSWVGDWPAHVILGLILLLMGYFRRSKRWMRICGAMILACALAGATSRIIKISAGRARPNVQTETEWNGPQFSSRYNAFPSGHTAVSTAFFATLALANWRIGLAFFVIPLLIGFSRMYVAAHHLSDVVGAILIGLITASIVVRWIPPEVRDPESKLQD